MIRSNTTKVLVYQGIIVKNISKMEHFMGKPDNLKFDVIRKTTVASETSEASKMMK